MRYAAVALLQQLPPPLAGRQRVQHVLVVLGGEPVQVDQAPPELRALLGRSAPLRDLDPRHLGQDAERRREVDLLDLFDEVEHVAALLAAEAVPGLLLLVHCEARRLLLVEWAEPDELPTRLAQPHVLLYDVYQVQAQPDLVTRVLGGKGAHRLQEVLRRLTPLCRAAAWGGGDGGNMEARCGTAGSDCSSPANAWVGSSGTVFASGGTTRSSRPRRWAPSRRW